MNSLVIAFTQVKTNSKMAQIKKNAAIWIRKRWFYTKIKQKQSKPVYCYGAMYLVVSQWNALLWASYAYGYNND